MTATDRVFCIDFGTAFTKVALRRSPGKPSDLVEYSKEQVTQDGINFLVLTLVVEDRSGPKPRFVCGAEAVDRPPESNVIVHRNWKSKLFGESLKLPTRAVPPGFNRSDPLVNLLWSPQFQQLAAHMHVPTGRIKVLQQLVGAAYHLPAAPASGPASESASPVVEIAVRFFAHLRELVLKSCDRLRIPDAAAIPCRIAVPALRDESADGVGARSEVVARILQKSGWPLHPDRGILTEPYANAVGVLTRGANVVQPTGRIHFRQMFRDGPLTTTLGDPKHYPAYRALVLDVGAFTTDFAAVTFRTGGKAVAEPDEIAEVTDLSVRVGVRDLDEQVLAVLPAEKAEWMRTAARAFDWEEFRKNVYSGTKGLVTPSVGNIGGLKKEKEAVKAAIADFTNRIHAEFRAFAADLAPVDLLELILTGGGCNIPDVRDGLLDAAAENYRKIHLPGKAKVAKKGEVTVPLSDDFVRGATALGGASLYFEKAYYG